MRRLCPIFLWSLLALALADRAAWAHQSSTTWSRVAIEDAGRVGWRIELSTSDLFEALSLDRDRDATDDEIRSGAERLHEYVLARLRLSGDHGLCTPTRRGLELPGGAERRVVLDYEFRCPPPLGRLVLEYDLFFDLDPRHTGFLRVSRGGTEVHRELKKGLARFEWNLGDAAAPASLGLLDYLASGVEHIYTGYDHILFVVALLLVSAVARRGRKAAVEPRGLRDGIGYVAKVVTAFTVAHSLTLIAAALDWLTLPSRFVESAIAASIVYVAAENLLLGDPRHRWALAFAFGLVHGLGFASLLRPILPPNGVVVPLLAFNLGVELGQLTIVALLFPALHAVAARAPVRYQRLAVGGGSAAIGLFGAYWLVQRIFGG